MIKYIIYFTASFLLLLGSSVQAQYQSGSINYRGVVNEKFVDSFLTAYAQVKDPMAVKQRVVHSIKNAKPEEFILNFKNGESYYENVPELQEEGTSMGSRAGITPYYTNNAKNMIIEMSGSFGNIAREPIEWEITSETKKIGDYICRQAKTTEKLYHRTGNHYYYKDVIAWFTPEIPLSYGPKHYKGLPGLILQIEDKEYTLTATKINLNPSSDVKIKRLGKNDKIISQQESFSRIREMTTDIEKRMSRNMESSQKWPLSELVHLDEFVISGQEEGERGRSYNTKKTKVIVGVELNEKRGIKRAYAHSCI